MAPMVKYALVMGALLLAAGIVAVIIALFFRLSRARGRFPAFVVTSTVALAPVVMPTMLIDVPIPLGLVLLSAVLQLRVPNVTSLFERGFWQWQISAIVVLAVMNYIIGRWLLSNSAAQSDAFRSAPDAPPHSAPGRGRWAASEPPKGERQ